MPSLTALAGIGVLVTALACSSPRPVEPGDQTRDAAEQPPLAPADTAPEPSSGYRGWYCYRLAASGRYWSFCEHRTRAYCEKAREYRRATLGDDYSYSPCQYHPRAVCLRVRRVATEAVTLACGEDMVQCQFHREQAAKQLDEYVVISECAARE